MCWILPHRLNLFVAVTVQQRKCLHNLVVSAFPILIQNEACVKCAVSLATFWFLCSLLISFSRVHLPVPWDVSRESPLALMWATTMLKSHSTWIADMPLSGWCGFWFSLLVPSFTRCATASSTLFLCVRVLAKFFVNDVLTPCTLQKESFFT